MKPERKRSKMKAKDYFAKYDERIVKDQALGLMKIDSVEQLLLEMSDELAEICKKRCVRRDSAFVAVINEMNQKWNVICSLFEKKYGETPLNRDAFRNVWILQMPVLKKFMRGELTHGDIFG